MIVRTKDTSYIFEKDLNNSLWVFMGTTEGIVEELQCTVGKPLKVKFYRVNPLTGETSKKTSVFISATAVKEVVEAKDALT